MSVSKALAASLRAAPTDNCTTDWSLIAGPACGGAASLWLSDKTKPAADTLARAATMLTQIETGALVPAGGAPAPLRWGPLAMTGTVPFRRCLHATAAALAWNEALSLLKKGRLSEARPLLGRAWRHCLAGGVWRHDAALAPPPLRPEFQATAAAAIDAVAADILVARSPAATAADATRRVALLQLSLSAPTATAALQRAATAALAAELAAAWAAWQTDVRPGAPATPASEAAAATAVALLLPTPCPPSLSAAARFRDVNLGAYGPDAAFTRRAGGRAGLLSLLSPRPEIEAAHSLVATILTEPAELPQAPPPW